MKTIVTTSDKSKTLFSEEFGEHYHSSFGAKTESEHIFIEAGLKFKSQNNNNISIFEMGFGTGLNALLSYKFAELNSVKIDFTSVEAYPINMEEVNDLKYPDLLQIDGDIFFRMHKADSLPIKITENFSFTLIKNKLESLYLEADKFDLVYFDAFSPEVQPELWTKEVFAKIYKTMKAGAVLTTYSCKGLVKRNLKASGFMIDKLPGPPGKREFLRAYKL